MNQILIAEDNPRVAALLKKGLETQGFITTISGDGQEALHLAQSQNFDMFILDLNLPSQDGLSVLKQLRDRDRRLPVIILTGRSDPKDKKAAMAFEANDYMTKPFSFKDLFSRIQGQLAQKNSKLCDQYSRQKSQNFLP